MTASSSVGGESGIHGCQLSSPVLGHVAVRVTHCPYSTCLLACLLACLLRQGPPPGEQNLRRGPRAALSKFGFGAALCPL
eukprot:2098353-Pyramimonas_sp.AAC.1